MSFGRVEVEKKNSAYW